jgi:hypothetical protein
MSIVTEEFETTIGCIFPAGHEGDHYCPADVSWGDFDGPVIDPSGWLVYPALPKEYPGD